MEEKERMIRTALLRAGFFLLIAGAGFLFVRFLLLPLLPLLIGFLAAALLAPLLRRIRLPRRAAAFLAVLLVYLLLFALIAAGITLLLRQLSHGAERLPALAEQLLASLAAARENLQRFLPADFAAANWPEEAIAQAVTFLSAKLMALLGVFTAALPRVFFGTAVSAVSAALAAADYENIILFLKRKTPPKVFALLQSLRRFARTMLRGYLKAYLLLGLLTFCIAAVGLLLLKVKNALGIALALALVDALPLLGSGAVLLPWAALCLLNRQLHRGVWLIALWAVIGLVRSAAEPRLLGTQVGLHPLAALTAMVLGLRWGGVVGMMAAPLLVLLVLHLRREASEL